MLSVHEYSYWKRVWEEWVVWAKEGGLNYAYFCLCVSIYSIDLICIKGLQCSFSKSLLTLIYSMIGLLM